MEGDNKDTDVITVPAFAVFLVREEEEGRLKSYRAETFLGTSCFREDGCGSESKMNVCRQHELGCWV